MFPKNAYNSLYICTSPLLRHAYTSLHNIHKSESPALLTYGCCWETPIKVGTIIFRCWVSGGLRAPLALPDFFTQSRTFSKTAYRNSKHTHTHIKDQSIYTNSHALLLFTNVGRTVFCSLCCALFRSHIVNSCLHNQTCVFEPRSSLEF